MKLSYRILLGAIAGAFSYLIFPRPGVWVLVFPMIVAMYQAVKLLSFWRSVLVGFITGMAFYVAHIYWISQYLGPEPLIALAILESAFFAIASGLIGWGTSRLQRHFHGTRLTFATAALVAGLWTTREHLSSHYPYGGFPWSRLAMTQSESVLGNWVFFGGMPLLSFVLAFASILFFELVIRHRSKFGLITAGGVAIALFAVPLLAPLSNSPEVGSLRIAAIQGNANAGLFSNDKPATFLKHHLAQARKFLATKTDFDVMVWPENSVDVNVLRPSTERDELASFVRNELHKPLIFGTATFRDGKLYNTSILWTPEQQNVDWYDKKRPVPFAEYVPDRAFWEKVSPLVNLIQVGYSFGERDGIFELADKKLGTLICFEIAVDEVANSLVHDGATLILSQTNNADFGHSDEAFQQLAIAKLRAIETGRAVVNVSTVGPSGILLPSGQTSAYLAPFQGGFIVQNVPLRSSLTPAYFVALPFDLSVMALTALALVFLGIAPRFGKRVNK